MKKIESLRERQEVALGVLIFFKQFCEQHDISFMLSYGTLLGAIRHKGFIPWDDDVDVMMTRTEYEKFISLWNNNLHPYYKFMSMETDKEYFAPLAKMYDDRTLLLQDYGQIEKKKYGIYIDVFVIDKLPDNYNVAAAFYEKNQKLRNSWGMAIRKFSAPSRSIVSFFGRIPVMIYSKIRGYHYYLDKYTELAQRYNSSGSVHAGVIIFGEGVKKEYAHKEQYEVLSQVLFEGVTFNGPKDCHQYLCQMYGDYMKIPKESERKIHPSFCYWK